MADRLFALDASFLHLEARPAATGPLNVLIGSRRRRPAMPSDVDLVAKLVEESVDELLTAPRWQ